MANDSAKRPVGLAQVSLIFACGTALFSDGYANGVIGEVNTILKRLYPDAVAHKNYGTTLSSVAFAGTIFGMIVFGYLSDRIGRKFGMMFATGIVALFSVLASASKGAGGSTTGMLSALIAFRFLLGIGVGAEYPCGAVASSEQSEDSAIAKNAQHRWLCIATNTMIDFGFVVAAFVPLVLLWIFKQDHLRAVWRISLGLGVIPAVAVFIWRLRMDETAFYKKSSMKRARIPYMLVLKRYWVQLAAISFTWFLYDFILYPFGIYSSTVIDGLSHGDSALTTVFGYNVVINLFYMPGTIGGAFIVDYLGPKNTMIFGLLTQAIMGFIMSGLYKQLTNHIAAFAVVYGLFLSFGEVGPGNCLFLLASKTGPTGVRGHFFGIAAAVGKVGAFVGTWAFPPMIDAFGGADSTRGNTGPFWVGSGMAILSAIVTFFFIRPLDHDGMIKEDNEFRAYLEANGYDTSQMGLVEDFDTKEAESSQDEKQGIPHEEVIVLEV